MQSVVRAALEEFDARVTAKNLIHPLDISKAVEMFAVLQQNNLKLDLNEIGDWLTDHGWGLPERSKVLLVSETLSANRKYRRDAGGTAFTPEQVYARWKGKVKSG